MQNVQIKQREQTVENITYTLAQIADLNLYDSADTSEIIIPEVQRGLVWEPRQVELLWDSILCEYPIGAFMIVNNELYDGQQRINAIIQGFNYNALFDKKSIPNSILWLDLGFEEDESLSRRYGFRLTTTAHPWGYRVEDGAAFQTRERRHSLKEVYGDDIKPKDCWDIRNFTPRGAKYPIPFAIMINAFYQNDQDFVDIVKSDCKRFFDEFSHSIKWNSEFEEQIVSACIKFNPKLQTLKKYTVIANKIDADKSNKKYLELFFNRINTGGTPITQEELAYSAIKLYWQDSHCKIAIVNRDIAKDYMPEAKLAQVVFRAMSSTDVIRSAIDAAFIRKLKEDDNDEEKQKIIKNINDIYAVGGSRLLAIMSQIDLFFLDDEERESTQIPKYIRVEIAHQSPTLYAFIFYLASLQIEGKSAMSNKFAAALILYLYCCCNTDERAIQYLYSNIKNHYNNDNILSEDNIRIWLSDCISFGWSNYINYTNNFSGFNNIQKSWNIWDFQYEQGGQHICQMFSYGNNHRQLSMLKVVERKAFNIFFNNYNPVRKDLWADLNRPWDDDHIIPKDWVDNKRGEYQALCKKWMWSIGNFAHIPFEKNREKNANADWEFYSQDDNATLLHFEEDITSLRRGFINNEHSVQKFVELTAKRFCRIYNDFIEFLKPLKIGEQLSDIQQIRKQTLLNYREDGYKLYHISGDNSIEFTAEDNYGWMQPRVAISNTDSNGTQTTITIRLSRGKIVDQWFPVQIERKLLSDTDNSIQERIERYFNTEGFTDGKIDSFIRESLTKDNTN